MTAQLQKWNLVFTFPLRGSTIETPSRVVAIMPRLPDDPNHGLPAWFFEPYTAPFHHEDGRITDEEWMYDSLEFWLDQRIWMFEWVPQMGPAPCWRTQRNLTFQPTDLTHWAVMLERLASWQYRTYGGSHD